MSVEKGLTPEELAAETATALPDKEVVSILDLNADIDLAIDAAAPIDLAIAANANVAAPINAAVGANILSLGSDATSVGDQGVMLNQNIQADATANATQDSSIDQSNDTIDDGTATGGTTTEPLPTDGTTTEPLPTDGTAIETGDALSGPLLNVDVNVDGDVDVAAPIDGAVAANANVAAPINAGVAANVGTVDSTAVSVAQQDAIINQNIEGSAEANANQTSDITQ